MISYFSENCINDTSNPYHTEEDVEYYMCPEGEMHFNGNTTFTNGTYNQSKYRLMKRTSFFKLNMYTAAFFQSIPKQYHSQRLFLWYLTSSHSIFIACMPIFSIILVTLLSSMGEACSLRNRTFHETTPLTFNSIDHGLKPKLQNDTIWQKMAMFGYVANIFHNMN